MKEGFRQCMSWLHTWSGLVVGWVLFFVFVTGTAGYFQYEITRWMQPERAAPIRVEPDAATSQRLLGMAMDRLEQVAPVAASWNIGLPHASLVPRGYQEFHIEWEEMPAPGHEWGEDGSERLDPATGAVLPPGAEPRETAGGRGLYRMHWLLHYMPYEWAVHIVGICTMLMLIAIVSGVITHKKIFTDFFTFRPGKGQRSWLDAHNAISVMALPFFLMITYSGLVFFLFTYMPIGLNAIYGTGPEAQRSYREEISEEGPHKHAAIGRPPIAVGPLLAQAEAAWGVGKVRDISFERHEGGPSEIVIARAYGGNVHVWDTPTLRFNAETGESLPPETEPGGGAALTQGVMLALHEGLFVAPWGRWLYFFAGLLGCAMIGTGLVLWTVKRRRHHLAIGQEAREQFGLRLVETLNVATIAGLPMAVASFFWANRLLPVGLDERAAWEFHALFAVWLGTLFYSLARPLRRAWVEVLWAACASYALLPLLNALTTDRHLGNTLAEGDWQLAGFDLTMFGLAALLAVMAVKVAKRLKPAGAPVSRPAPGAAVLKEGRA